MNLLLTAFEPFGGEVQNASLEVLNALPVRIGALEITKRCLPVSFDRAPALAGEAAERLRPDAIVLLGQAGGRGCITPERTAVNRMDAAGPDNDGRQPRGLPVISGGPASYASTLPVEAMAAAMRRAGVPARLSDSAGTYVCNCLMYAMLHRTRLRSADVPCGFLHIPYLEHQLRRDGVPALPMDAAVSGITAALQALEAYLTEKKP